MNSKAKGKRYELEVASKLREYGYDVRRTVQYCGKTEESADLRGLPNIHIECKHYKTMGFSYEWLDQAVRDAKHGIPAVFHRINGRETVVTLRLEDFMYIYNESTLPDEELGTWQTLNG